MVWWPDVWTAAQRTDRTGLGLETEHGLRARRGRTLQVQSTRRQKMGQAAMERPAFSEARQNRR